RRHTPTLHPGGDPAAHPPRPAVPGGASSCRDGLSVAMSGHEEAAEPDARRLRYGAVQLSSRHVGLELGLDVGGHDACSTQDDDMRGVERLERAEGGGRDAVATRGDEKDRPALVTRRGGAGKSIGEVLAGGDEGNADGRRELGLGYGGGGGIAVAAGLTLHLR